MNQTFTPLDLIRFLYHETDRMEDQAIAVALEEDQQLNDEFKTLQLAYHHLNVDLTSPGKPCLDRILQFSTQKPCDEFVA